MRNTAPYISHNGIHRHELDHTLCNRKVHTDLDVMSDSQTGSGHDCSEQSSTLMVSKQCWIICMALGRPPLTILNVEVAERLAEMYDFEELDAIDEGYDKLVAAITTIRGAYGKKKPNHSTSRITEEI
ncbi:hypothetical protein Aduo_008974 [Ancylostoma duodenale]